MPTRIYKTSDYLQTLEDHAAYLNAVLDEADFDLFIQALKNIADAQVLDNPIAKTQLFDLNKLLHQAGLKLTVEVEKQAGVGRISEASCDISPSHNGG